MSGIFICYRRGDSAYAAGRLYDRLAAHFGGDRIFRDIDTVKPGVDFVQLIDTTVASADALVAVIGDDWADARGADGRRRLDDPNDWVRLEIATALKLGILVLPVLVENARMAEPAALPADLRDLARRQAVELTDRRWASDVQQIIEALQDVVAPKAVTALPSGQPSPPLHPSPPPQPSRPHRWTEPGARIALITGLVIAAVVVAATVTVRVADSGRSTTTLPSGSGSVDATHLDPPDMPTEFSEFAIPTENSGPSGITIGPDGAIWFTERAANQIGRITPTGEITEFPIPTPNAGLDSIVTGPDGALWFTEERVNKIGRITTAGVVTEFTTPSTTSNPMGRPDFGAGASSLTVGPGQDLWFVETLADKIGRITTTGAVSDFPLPSRETSHASPGGITLGSDGALWFTEVLGSRIGRIDPTSRVFSEFPLPATAGITGLASIVAGPDGALWFADTGRIGRIATTGEITLFEAPFATTPGGEHMAAGAGALWFTESRVNRIARLTTAGELLEASLPTPDAGLARLVVAKDGAVWFTEAKANKIGRLTQK